MNLKYSFFVLFMSLLIVGCRSSRSGTSHSEIETDYLKTSRSDSIDFRERFAHYLSEQESNLHARIIEFYPPIPDDTASHGPVKSITDLDFSSKNKADSVIEEKQLTCSSDTTSIQAQEKKKEYATYQIKKIPWYQPFIPYLILAILATILYYFRKK